MTSQANSVLEKPDSDAHPLTMRQIFRTWWPLAASWLLMGIELPAVSAVILRLADPVNQLAAYGGIVFPLAILIEGPIIMMLAASTALCKDRVSYRRVFSYMMRTSFVLTLVHALVAFTPLYDFVARTLIGAPPEVADPGRIGLMAMLPWTWCIAYRRFQQGVLIRFGQSGSVGVGTVIRLLATGGALAVGFAVGDIPGVLVGASAVTFGVLIEAIYAGVCVRAVLRTKMPERVEDADGDMSLRSFLVFYAPLALTPVLTIIAQPTLSGAMQRMREPVHSVDAWTAIYGLVFMVRCLGLAFNEVVITLSSQPGAVPALRRFTFRLVAVTTLMLLLASWTPFASFWFETVLSLTPDLAELAGNGLRLMWILPAISALQSWYQGTLVHRRRTRGITEGVCFMLVVLFSGLTAGVAWNGTTGLYVAIVAYLAGAATNVAWLAYRVRTGTEAVKA